MFRHHLVLAFRNLNKYRGYSFINIFGLAIGMTCTILILMWIQDEMSYDRFHENANNIYRVALADLTYQPTHNYPVTPPTLAKAMRESFPEIQAAVSYFQKEEILVRYNDKSFKEHIGFASAEIFDIFTLPLVEGNAQTALQAPWSVLLTEEMAGKLFGSQNPLGNMIIVDNKFNFTVTGMLKDIPSGSYLNFGLLTSNDHIAEITGRGNMDSWNQWGNDTFILLGQQTDVAGFNAKIADFAAQSYTYEWQPSLFLQPLTDIHIRDLNGGGMITYIYIFGIIAGFVLLIACINFMNLATARSTLRAKEIGLRKVVGAGKSSLIRQFYGEAFITVLLALLMSLLLVELLLPAFNSLTGKTLSLDFAGNYHLILVLIAIALVTGSISGSYPALYLSSIRPISALKGAKLSGSTLFRKFLVVFQFLLSITLIIATMVVSDQMRFIRNRNLGFNKEQIVYLPLNQDLKSKYSTLKSELLQNSGILHVTASSSKLGVRAYGSTDVNQWEGNPGERSLLMNMIFADYDFTETFGLSVVQGRFFSEQFAGDSDAVVLNETAVREMGLSNPVGTKIYDKIPIIGVIRDFNFQSLHTIVKPLALFMKSDEFDFMAIKIDGNDIPATIKVIETITTRIAPDFPFEYQFLDEEFDNLYRSELRLGRIFNYFSILAIIISCLGLFGLASFMVSRRTKEIGIRKAIGASTPNIIVLTSSSFIKWVMVANLLAWPIAWFAMHRWLETFAYRITIHWWTFLLAGSLALTITILTVSYQSVKAAIANPVKSLRYE